MQIRSEVPAAGPDDAFHERALPALDLHTPFRPEPSGTPTQEIGALVELA